MFYTTHTKEEKFMKKKLIAFLLPMFLIAALVMQLMPAGKPITADANTRIANNGFNDIHNSYAWCAEMFTQTDGDYLWVGTNRDLGAGIVTVSGVRRGLTDDELIDYVVETCESMGIPIPSEDNAGKVYRIKMGETYARWELMFETTAFSGYRKMLIFNEELYVFAGLRSVHEDAQYSAIFRFDKGFSAGDEPDIVLWEELVGSSTEYFRAGCELDGYMYVGTQDAKIYRTDGTGLTSLTPMEGPKSTGWELIDLRALATAEGIWDAVYTTPIPPNTQPASGTVWDLIGFNDYLYAFVNAPNGFRLFKLEPDADVGNFGISQIVGAHSSARFAGGMGIQQHAAASPFLSTQYGKDYVYVTTFAPGPEFLGSLLMGDIVRAFRVLFAPATIYRFDEHDNWEVVVGDEQGRFIAREKPGYGGAPVPSVENKNQRAGFFPGTTDLNPSANQYIWWMAEYNGRMYASTWNLGKYRDSIAAAVTPDALAQIAATEPAVAEMIDAFIKDTSSPLGFNLFVTDDGESFEPVTVNGFGDHNNYGGRVILPTEHGLFLTTANPYTGCQVWRVEDVEPGLRVDLRNSIKVTKNKAHKFFVRLDGMTAKSDDFEVSINGTGVSATIDFWGYAEPPHYSSVITIVDDATVFGGKKYVEVPNRTYVYEVTVTGKIVSDRTQTITIKVGDLTFQRELDVEVVPESLTWLWVLLGFSGGVAVGVGAFIAVLLIRRKVPFLKKT